MVLLSKEGTQRTELAALAVNLSLQSRCAVLMAGSGRLAALATRAFRATDLLMIKLIRNLSQHQENHRLFIVRIAETDLSTILSTILNTILITHFRILLVILQTSSQAQIGWTKHSLWNASVSSETSFSQI